MLFVGKWSALLSIYDTIDKLRSEGKPFTFAHLEGKINPR